LLDALQPSTVDAIHDALSDLDRSDLDAAEARDDWRRACTSEPGRCYQPAAPGTLDVPDHCESAEPIETLILRRGSTRLMARRTVPSVALIWVLSAATRPVPADAIAAGHTLLTHELAIQGVEGQAPGLYRWVAGTLAHRKASAEIEARDLATYLCLGQPLGGDSAYTVFESADLDAVLDTLGPAATGPPTWKPGSSTGACSSPPTLSAREPPASPSSMTRSEPPSPPTPAAYSSPRSEPPPTGPPPAASPAARRSSSTSRP
jgi:hypothetical protein